MLEKMNGLEDAIGHGRWMISWVDTISFMNILRN